MASYIIFFGSSDGFTYVPFDESGKVLNFDRLFPDFDVLETSSFIIDNVNNSAILAKYFLKIKGKNYSILKLYGYGQSAISSRVEGSNIGVAFFSDHDIELDKKNIEFLQVIYDNFTSICLSNKKFKDKTFEKEAILIHEAFANKYGLTSIVQKELIDISTYKNSSEGYQLPSFKQDFFERIKNNAARTYFTTDQLHLERIYKRWQGSFKAFLYQNNQFISIKELEENEKKKQELKKIQLTEQERGRKGGSEAIIQQLTGQNSDTHERLERATKAYHRLEYKNRKMFRSCFLIIIILLCLNLFQFLQTPEDKINIQRAENVLPAYHFDNFNALEKAYLDSLLKDTSKMEILNPLLKFDYQFRTQKPDSVLKNKLTTLITRFNSKTFSKIDSSISINDTSIKKIILIKKER